tara:strand:- start:556 stop:702 length:147 start_codon:yes stop_codon:yes gene_type:complete
MKLILKILILITGLNIFLTTFFILLRDEFHKPKNKTLERPLIEKIEKI